MTLFYWCRSCDPVLHFHVLKRWLCRNAACRLDVVSVHVAAYPERRARAYMARTPLSFTLSLSVFPSAAVVAALAHETDSSVSTHWYTDRKFTIVVTAVLVILPLSIPKEIGFQKYARYGHSASVHTQGPNSFSSMSGVVFFACSALSVLGTWYVTVVVIIKYIWPDKEVTPGFGSTRWAILCSFKYLGCVYVLGTASLTLL